MTQNHLIEFSCICDTVQLFLRARKCTWNLFKMAGANFKIEFTPNETHKDKHLQTNKQTHAQVFSNYSIKCKLITANKFSISLLHTLICLCVRLCVCICAFVCVKMYYKKNNILKLFLLHIHIKCTYISNFYPYLHV